jgi:hypothetical protein
MVVRVFNHALADFKANARAALTAIVSALKRWWQNLADYLKASINDNWSTVDEMFRKFDEEGYNASSSDFNAGTKTRCPPPSPSRLHLLTIR